MESTSESEDRWATSNVAAEQQRKTGGGARKVMAMWLFPFTRLHRIPVVKRIWVYLIFIAGYTWAVDWFIDSSFPVHKVKEAGASAFTSIILGVLLVFRTNTAYERWSEGRRLWGQLVNDSRNLCLKMQAYVEVSDAEKTEFAELVVSFAYALKHHLRDTRPAAALPGVPMAALQTAKNLPVFISNKMFQYLARWQKNDRLPGITGLQLDTHSRAFMDILGACERIRSTPLAVSYRAFMRQGIALNLLTLPWYVLPELDVGWGMPIIIIWAYFLIGLELIAEGIEDPFGQDGDDLPLDTICANIQNTVSDIARIDKKQQQFTMSKLTPIKDPLKDTTELRKLEPPETQE